MNRMHGLFCCCLLFGSALILGSVTAPAHGEEPVPAASPFLVQLADAFRQVSQVVEPSVVSIEILGRAPSRGQGPSGEPMLPPGMEEMLPPGFEEFFRRGPQTPQEGDPQDPSLDRFNPARPQGHGSGWVYDTVGHIITNHHVVHQADEIRVRFADGRTYSAQLVGGDRRSDIAVIRIDAQELTAARIAPGPVEKGDIVFAFGSPFRFDFSMSMGIVSATGRTNVRVLGQGGFENFIQTDAAINPGNSGGPLTNIYGQVVGMNTAIVTGSAMRPSFAGLGFAIPADMVVRVASQLIETGEVQRGFLGIELGSDEAFAQIARTFGYEGSGVMVNNVIEGYPAAAAGVQAGDIITAVNGKPVTSADQLRNTIADLGPGTQVKLGIFRDDKLIDLDVTLGRLPERVASVGPDGSLEATDPDADARTTEALQRYGIEALEAFTPALASQSGMPMRPGVLVTRVRQGSMAAVAGLMRGTLITQVMGEAVSSPEALLRAVREHESSATGIRLRVAQWVPQDRRYAERFVVLTLPEQ